MRVPIIDLRAQLEAIRSSVYDALHRVVESQKFILGAEVERLESGISRLCGTEHAVGCASGSDALMLSVASLIERSGLPSARFPSEPGPPAQGGSGPVRPTWAASGSHSLPEVITVPFTFFASAGSVVHAGARPRFVDIEPDGYAMDAARVPDALTARTLAVLPVHLFGQPCDMGAILRSAGAVPVIEDAAQAIGAFCEIDGKRHAAGSIGLLGCLSFFPTKNLGGAGDGGMVLTSDAQLADRIRQLRVHGGRQMYRHDAVGWNSRLDELQAAVLNVKLEHLERWSAARAARAGVYDELLGEAGLLERGLISAPRRLPGRSHTFHQYVVRVPPSGAGRSREGLREHLSAAGIGTGVYYPLPLHLQPCFRDLGHRKGDFPISERAAEEVLALPVYPELTDDQQALVAGEMARYFGLA